jgi:ribosomal protein S18
MSVKARLRAKARKKARKAQKKKGGFLRKKVCRFCADSSVGIDYKDPKGLRYFMTETGKLSPSGSPATARSTSGRFRSPSSAPASSP